MRPAIKEYGAYRHPAPPPSITSGIDGELDEGSGKWGGADCRGDTYPNTGEGH
jgi:hypothetical protein